MKTVLVITEYSYPNDIIAAHRYEQLGKYLTSYGYKMEVFSIKVGANENDRSFFLSQYNDDIKSELKKYWVSNLFPKISKIWIFNKIREILYFTFYGSYPYQIVKGFTEKLQSVIEESRPDVILASAPSGIPLNIAYKIKARYNIPILVDFRDLLNEIPAKFFYRRVLKGIALKKENMRLRRVDGFITVSEPLRAKLMTRCKCPGAVIQNGFDPSAFGKKEVVQNKKMKLVYAGNFYLKDGRDPFLLFDALDLFLKKHKNASIEVVFYGGGNLLKFYKGRLCEGVIREFGRVDHKSMLEIERNADVLLFFTNPKWKGILTGKLPEYIGVGKRILAIPGDYDVVREAIIKTQSGIVVYGSTEGFEALEGLYLEWKRTGYIKNDSLSAEVAKFSRKNQAKELSIFLNRFLVKN